MADATMIGSLKCTHIIIRFAARRAGSSNAVSAVLNFLKPCLRYGAHSIGSVPRNLFLITLSHSIASETVKFLS